MASQVLSGASNASYTNNTGQNVRLIINYMSNVTSMTWAEVTVTASATTIGKDIQNITGEFRSAVQGERIAFTRHGAGTRQGDIESQTYEIELSANPLYLRSATDYNFSGLYPVNNTTYRSRELGSSFSRDYSGILQNEIPSWSSNIFYVPLTISRGGDFPVELMLSNGQSFSSICSAYNAIVIKEDGT